jgi:hypothetical protein
MGRTTYIPRKMPMRLLEIVDQQSISREWEGIEGRCGKAGTVKAAKERTLDIPEVTLMMLLAIASHLRGSLAEKEICRRSQGSLSDGRALHAQSMEMRVQQGRLSLLSTRSVRLDQVCRKVEGTEGRTPISPLHGNAPYAKQRAWTLSTLSERRFLREGM